MPDNWRHVTACDPRYKFQAISLLTDAVIAVGDDRSRVESAAETLVGIGGFEIIGKDGKRV